MKNKRGKLHKKIRKAFQKIHLWVGLAICVPIVVIGLTGSILVFQENIADLSAPEFVLQDGTPHSANEIINIAQKSAPDGVKATMYIAPSDGEAPAKVRFSPASKESKATPVTILVDTASLKILSIDYPDSGLLRQVFMLHSYFLVKEYGGRNIVGWIGVAMLLMSISGIIIWWPKKGKWKKALTVKNGAKGLRLHRDLHSVVGIWGILVLLTLSFTGVYLAFPKIVGGAISGVSGARDLRSMSKNILATPVEGKPKISIDKAIDIAKNSVEKSQLISAMLPSKPDQPYRVNLAYEGYSPRTPAIAVFIDPWSEQVLTIQDPRDYAAAEKFMAWQHTVHEGRGFGWLWRGLVFLAGFSPLLFAITGVSMWLIKRKN